MRRAKPDELETRAIPAMTARLTEAELLRWVPVDFDEIADPLATPEPSKGALIKLDTGAYVVLYYGKDSHQLVLELPETTKDSSALIAAFLEEVPLPPSRVLWHRPDISLPKGKAASAASAQAKRSARRASLPRKQK